MNSQDKYNDQQGQWHHQAFHQANPWPNTHNGGSQAFRQEIDSFQPFEQQSTAAMIPNVPLFSSNPQSQRDYSSLPYALPSSSNMRAQPGFSPSKAPNFANILQSQEPAASQAKHDNEGRPAAQARRPRARTHRVNPKDWDKYKAHIKKLYLEKGKTVTEIMEEMRNSYSFNASEQMYKNKLGDWGFSKYMPKGLPEGLTHWVTFKIDERKVEGRETEFMYKDRVLPIDKIQQSAKRTKYRHDAVPFDKATPLGVVYYTPSNNDNVPSPIHTSIVVSPLSHTTAHTQWRPRSNVSDPKLLHLRVQWKGLTLTDLECIRREAKPLSESGRLEEAEQKLRDALDGLEYLLLSTNERTLSVAYELAEFYSQNHRPNDADAVLQWMGEELVKTFGLDHQKTISHMVNVVDLYQQWSRSDDAVTILLRAMDSFHNPHSTKHDPATTSGPSNGANGTTKNSEMDEAHRISTLSRMIEVSDGNGRKDADLNLEFQLTIINARTRANDPETEALILKLIEKGENLPDQFEGLILKSRGALIDLYLQLGKHEELESALRIAKARFFVIMKQKKPKSSSLLDAGVELASMFVKASRFKEADKMFSQLERDITDTVTDDDCDNAIDMLIDIGMLYQVHKRWNDARARFEHALALTISSRGAECKLAKRLQAALDNRSFDRSSLPIVWQKSSLRKRLMEF